jgi:hypothetical protein
MNIDRRDFIKTATLASVATAVASKMSAAEQPPVAQPAGRDYYEWRCYRLKADAPQTLLDGYLEKALIPALNARGIAAVGVFTEPDAKDGPAVWVLIPHASLESVAAVTAAINADPTVQAAAAGYFTSTNRATPAFDRVDSWLLWAFAGLPRYAVPKLKLEGKTRIFEMRTYESYNEVKALNKVDMFNDGEIELMQNLNMSPVFYGQALVGRDLPHLTYMLCSADRESHAKAWSEFGKHPVWQKLKSDPRYQDNVTKIVSRFMVPAAYSQI